MYGKPAGECKDRLVSVITSGLPQPTPQPPMQCHCTQLNTMEYKTMFVRKSETFWEGKDLSLDVEGSDLSWDGIPIIPQVASGPQPGAPNVQQTKYFLVSLKENRILPLPTTTTILSNQLGQDSGISSACQWQEVTRGKQEFKFRAHPEHCPTLTEKDCPIMGSMGNSFPGETDVQRVWTERSPLEAGVLVEIVGLWRGSSVYHLGKLFFAVLHIVGKLPNITIVCRSTLM